MGNQVANNFNTLSYTWSEQAQESEHALG